MDVYIDESLVQRGENYAMAHIDIYGQFVNGSSNSGNAVESISCAYQNDHKQTSTFSQVFENADGSVTMLEPRLLRGDRSIPLSATYSSAIGICRLLGFDQYLDESLKQRGENYAMAHIDVYGQFVNGSSNSGNAVESISCFMNGDYQQTGFAQKVEKGLDGSYTLTNPLVIRGLDIKPVSATYSNATGICRLFGFASFLDESLEQRGENYAMAHIDTYGSFVNGSSNSGNAVQSITCYNGRYKTTAIAGGFVFQNGEWVGQLRRSSSRWGSNQPLH